MNYYNILGVPENATQQEIKSAYRNMINAFHPDHYRGPNKKFAEQKTKELIEAYEVLKDPETRAAYDRKLKTGSYSWAGFSGEKREKKEPEKEEHKEKPKEETREEKTTEGTEKDKEEDSGKKEDSNKSERTSKTDSKPYNQKQAYIKYFIIALVIVVGIFAAMSAAVNRKIAEAPNSSEAISILGGFWDFDHVASWDSDGNEVDNDLTNSYIGSDLYFGEDGSINIHFPDENYVGKWTTEEDGRIIITEIYPEDDRIKLLIDTISCYKDDDGYFVGWQVISDEIMYLFVYLKN